jgi:hypothetical protein
MSDINRLVQESFDIKNPDSWFDKKDPDDSASYVPTFIKDWIRKFKGGSDDKDVPNLTPECQEDKKGEFKCNDRGYEKEADSKRG